MNLDALTLLVEIIDAGNLSEAARRLKTSRSNVSYQIKQFEKEIGQQLLRRTTRRVEPTEIGYRLYEHGQAVRHARLAAEETVATLGQGPQGRIRISVPSAYGQVVMSDWLVEFKGRYPGIVLDVMFQNRVADLLQGEVDISIRVISEPPQNLVSRDLGPVHYVACASREYAETKGMPVELDQLRMAPIVTSAVIGRQLRLFAYQGGERHEVILEPSVISENIIFLRKIILSGLGIGIVPDHVMLEDIEKGEVVTIFNNYRLSTFGTHMYMLYMPNIHHTRATSLLIDFILEKARAERQASEIRRSAAIRPPI
jgi:DNA-binding transcriptional LysR family regulator